MFKSLKNPFFILAFFILFCSVNCIAGGLQLQIEEGWRWKRSLNLYVTTGEPVAPAAAAAAGTVIPAVYGPIPVQQIHEEMAQHETMLTSHLNRHQTNIAIASITLVLQMVEREQGLFWTTDWLRGAGEPVVTQRKRARDSSLEEGSEASGADEDAEAEKTPPNYRYLFLSTADAKLREGIDAGWGRPILDQGDGKLWDHLNGFIADVAAHGLGRAFNGFGLGKQPFPRRGGGFAPRFQHSEQKLIHYLWDFTPVVHAGEGAEPAPRPFNESELHRQILRILGQRGLGVTHFNRVKLIILHVHSCRDPCLPCRLSLSLFALKAQAGFRGLDGVDTTARFIVTVSSRVEYRGESRYVAGHGSLYDSSISLNVGPLREYFAPLPPPRGWQPIPQLAHLPPPPIRILEGDPDFAIEAPAATAAAPIIGTFSTVVPDLPFLDPRFSRLPD